MSQLVGRGVAFGISLVWEMDRRAMHRGTSRSAEVVRYISLAMDARMSGCSRQKNGHLDDTSRGHGRATVWAASDLWEQVDMVAQRLGASLSETVRIMVHAGLALASPEPDVGAAAEMRDRALAILVVPQTAVAFAKTMWPETEDGRLLSNCARRLLMSLKRDGLVIRKPREWNSSPIWHAKPEVSRG